MPKVCYIFDHHLLIFVYLIFSLSDAGFPVRLLPKVVDPGTVIGYVTSAIIPHPGSISVYVALGDLQCAFRSGIRDNNVAGKQLNLWDIISNSIFYSYQYMCNM